MAENLRHFFEFDQFRIYPTELLVERSGTAVDLSEKARRVLTVLVENHNHFVSSTELLNRVWGVAGEIGSVYHAIGELKPLFRKYIKMVKGTGYRFEAKGLIKKEQEDHDATSRNSIAVLPFRPYGLPAHPDTFGLSIADTLIIKLGNVKELVVRPTSSIIKYNDGPVVDSIVAGRQLNVDRVVQGWFEHNNNQLRVNIQLIDIGKNAVLWGETFSAYLNDQPTLEGRIAAKLASIIIPTLTVIETAQISKGDTDNSEAYALYCQGRFHWHKSISYELERAIEFFKKALEVDSTYARAYAGIADAYTMLAWFGNTSPLEIRPKVKEYATKALDRCELPEAHTSLATYLECYERNMSDAERHYREACELYPSYDVGHQAYADYLTRMERFPEAHEQYDKAISIHPFSPFTNTMKGWAYLYEGKPDQAIHQAEIALTYNRDYFLAHLVIGEAYQQQGKQTDAISLVKKAVVASKGHAFTESWLAIAHALAGERKAARSALSLLLKKSQQGYIPPYFFALIYASLGDNDDALKWLEKASTVRDSYFQYARVEMYNAQFRADERFRSILREAQLMTTKIDNQNN